MNHQSEAAEPQVPSAKLDPEALTIRARPARAIRFKRGAVIGIAAIGAIGLVAVAWLALKPQVFRQVARESELSEPTSKGASDALAKLPTDYGDAPRLGPPLPGDLGRPILRAQQAMADASLGANAIQADPDTAKLQHTTELRAARESGLLVQILQRREEAVESRAMMSPELAGGANGGAAPTGPSAPLAHKQGFMATLDKTADANPHALTAAVSPNMLVAGSVIPASLITGLNSDLPGMVIAQVTQNVFDSASGANVLIPQGARLLGAYDSVVAFGQKRALVAWQRIIFPDGSSLRIDNMPATDPAGYAGLADKVDFHTWTLLKGIALATLLGVGSELSFGGESNLVEAIRESTQQNASRAGSQITSRNLDVQPSITIRPGAPVRLIVQKDLILAPWRG